MSYYLGKERALTELFGATSVRVGDGLVQVDDRRYPVVDDVIITLPSHRLPKMVQARVNDSTSEAITSPFAEDVQFTFGAEWTEYGEVLDDHRSEFQLYFDLIDLNALADLRVADLGCGSGRWASFVAPHCREIVLADFSDAIFVARENLKGHENAIFVLADVLQLPFADDSLDLSYCLGVLHHLPSDALEATRQLARLGPRLLVYLYYALDNRPAYFRLLLRPVTCLRNRLATIRHRRVRTATASLIALTVYGPLSLVGRFGGSRARRYVPLADTYAGKSLQRLRQDAYDRFFTRIEQRFSRAQIMELEDTFQRVEISDGLPYWHFVCTR